VGRPMGMGVHDGKIRLLLACNRPGARVPPAPRTPLPPRSLPPPSTATALLPWRGSEPRCFTVKIDARSASRLHSTKSASIGGLQ